MPASTRATKMIGRQVRFTTLTISPTTTKMDAPTIVSPRYVPAFAASVRSAVRWSANHRATSSSIGSTDDSQRVRQQPAPADDQRAEHQPRHDRADGDLLPAGALVAGGVTAVGRGRRGGHGRQSGGRAPCGHYIRRGGSHPDGWRDRGRGVPRLERCLPSPSPSSPRSPTMASRPHLGRGWRRDESRRRSHPRRG